MSDKRLLVSDERVKKLTPEQWIFHAAEINARKDKELDNNITILDSALTRIEDSQFLSGFFARTDLSLDKVKQIHSDIINDRKRQRAKKGAIEEDDARTSLMKDFNEIKDVAPEVLEVTEINEFMESMPKVTVPRRKRRRKNE